MPSVLRRYTPPTCTLEIRANESALSRWTDRAVVNRLRFRLQFDDPRFPADQQITLEGDRAVLDALSTVIDEYVQAQLVDPQDVVSLGAIASDVGHYRAIALQNTSAATVVQSPTASTSNLSIQPQGAFSHILNLGDLATDASGPAVKLSTIQLFDLATALDDCASDVVALSTEQRRLTWLNPSSGWLRAAAVLVLALGTTMSVVKFVDPNFQTATTPQNQTASSEDQQYSGVAIAPDIAESELTVPQVDPEELESIPPPPEANRSSPSPRTPRVTVPSEAPIPPIADEAPPTVASPVPSTDLPPAVILPSPTPDANADASSSLALETAPAPSQAQLREAPQPETFSANPDAARAMPEASGTVFDVIPQVAEVRTYFEERWQPPEGLSTDLQYSITLNPDGSVQRVEPLGQASATYVDRTSIPLSGEPFVSTVEDGSAPRIRLVLSPDGEVQTFLESR